MMKEVPNVKGSLIMEGKESIPDGNEVLNTALDPSVLTLKVTYRPATRSSF